MPQAIGPGTTSAATLAYGGSKPSPAGLQAQLQRFQQQLSDCVNCASADTPQGKADIQSLAARISQVKQNIAQLDSGSPGRAGAAPTAATAERVAPASASWGSVIDVFA